MKRKSLKDLLENFQNFVGFQRLIKYCSNFDEFHENMVPNLSYLITVSMDFIITKCNYSYNESSFGYINDKL